MKKWIALLLISAMLTLFVGGCATPRKDPIRCPKCGFLTGMVGLA
jgi:hypothetical protein